MCVYVFWIRCIVYESWFDLPIKNKSPSSDSISLSIYGFCRRSQPSDPVDTQHTAAQEIARTEEERGRTNDRPSGENQRAARAYIDLYTGRGSSIKEDGSRVKMHASSGTQEREIRESMPNKMEEERDGGGSKRRRQARGKEKRANKRWRENLVSMIPIAIRGEKIYI